MKTVRAKNKQAFSCERAENGKEELIMKNMITVFRKTYNSFSAKQRKINYPVNTEGG